MVFVGLLVSYPMLADHDDAFTGLLRWMGPAAISTAAVPLVMLQWDQRRRDQDS
jgi:hypothetical protein